MVLRALFQEILTAITALRPLPPADVEDQRQTWPIWLSAGTGVPTQACGPHLAHTVFVDQGFRRRPSELTLAERPVWWLSYICVVTEVAVYRAYTELSRDTGSRMGLLDNPMFWVGQESNVGKLQTDGSLKYMLLDSDYNMLPLIRKKDTTFTDFLASDADAKKCKIIVNGNMYGLDKTGAFWVGVGRPDDPSDTLVQGRVVFRGKIIAGDSRPQSFWFGQLLAPTPEGSIFVADKGDPPITPSTIAAIGGVGPLIAGAMTYGIGNLYKPGAPPGVNEPATGQPPAPAMPYLIQRNNETFRDASARPPETGKTIVAYCSQKKMLLVAVQPNGVAPGQTHSALATALAQRGFDSAVFFDGSDSATLVVDGKLEVTPGGRKNDSIDVGIGFYQ